MKKLSPKNILASIAIGAIAITSPIITGCENKEVDVRINEDYVQWQYEDSDLWTNLITVDEIKDLLEETNESTKTAYELFCEMCGDINLDGSINNQDIIELKGRIDYNLIDAKTEILGDVNRDNSINHLDYFILNHYISNNQQPEITLPYTTDINIVYGDLNLDGDVSSQDLTILGQYVENNTELSFQAMLNANVYIDTNIDDNDITTLARYLSKISKTVSVHPTLICGDINSDNVIDVQDAKLLKGMIDCGLIDGNSRFTGDINRDNQVNYLDYFILNHYTSNNTQPEITLPYTTNINIVYGDLNLDSEVDAEDLTLLAQHVENKTELSLQAMLNANVYVDTNVDDEDITTLSRYLAGISNTLPVYPETN